MKRIIPIFLILIFALCSCNGHTPDVPSTSETLKEEPYQFVTKSIGTYSIMPTYKYLGWRSFTDEKAIRDYHIWENKFDGKYVIIYNLIAKQGTFPPNLQWINEYDSIYHKGMRAAYITMGERPLLALQQFGVILPDCFILAQEVHHNDKEAVIRILVVPDKMCAEDYEPVMEELDRVIVKTP